LGYYCKETTLEKIRRFRFVILIVTVVALTVLILLCLSDVVRNRMRSIERILWLAEPYQASRAFGNLGLIYRIIIAGSALVFGSFILSFAPKKKNFLSFLGKNSIVIFVFHGYFIQFINDFFTFDPASISGVLILIAISLGITAFLSISWWNRGYMWLMNFLKNLVIKEKQ
jgi:fucose 4-O-acetylase-like acetyltransferase